MTFNVIDVVPNPHFAYIFVLPIPVTLILPSLFTVAIFLLLVHISRIRVYIAQNENRGSYIMKKIAFAKSWGTKTPQGAEVPKNAIYGKIGRI